jgi:uncharacterized membrane protein (DUF373 family)
MIPGRWVERVEELFHVILGVFLLGIAVAALYYSVVRVFETTPFFPTGMIQAINDILFIIIILEILRTVVARYTDGVFQLQNFLIIGVIAAVRHILTVGASMTLASPETRPTRPATMSPMKSRVAQILFSMAIKSVESVSDKRA